ncbi:MAG: aconitate hydratase AcnA [Deltaproteobacteria bacterium]|nr:aconitate hydratase AcnA [Deltaproteobacteria bacterium]
MDSFGARATWTVGDRTFEIFRLAALDAAGLPVQQMPWSLRILLENLLRNEDGVTVTRDDIAALASWDPTSPPAREIAFRPARVLLQDFTGVPAVVDLAAMRDAMAELGGDPSLISPLQPVELVVDHSVQVDAFGSPDAFGINEERDYARNRERYAFLRWGQQAFDGFRVVPPNTGIVHQVNLEYLARVVFDGQEPGARTGEGGLPRAYPDTLVGTDSHTPMINGLGVLGWGVGGIEAEAAMLGQPISMLIPEVLGFELQGRLPEGATATDLVLTVTERLRQEGVVGKFVEFFGPGVANLSLADRATIGNMTPEYGATCAIFPVDQVTLDYLRFTGRSEARVRLVEAYMREQGLFHTPDTPAPRFAATVTLDLGTVVPSIAGPKRPQDRIPLPQAGDAFREALRALQPAGREARSIKQSAEVTDDGRVVGVWGENAVDASTMDARANDAAALVRDGSVVIAAITSCTNTSNPSVMVAAGLLARNAVERGLRRKPWVKSSLAPGSKVVTDYLAASGLQTWLDALGFNLVGYGCTTCIGNSGPLPEQVAQAVRDQGLVVCSALSGNRNFEGRINSDVRANYLMSPPLVVAYALAGRMDIDLTREPLGEDRDGEPVYLRDIWPKPAQITETIQSAVRKEQFERRYEAVFDGDERWRSMDVPGGERFAWDQSSTYVRQPSYFAGMKPEAPERVEEIRGARVIALLGDSVTTDHISPAGSIKKDSPAGRYLQEQGVEAGQFNSYGSRRGNHEVMVRGTFANTRIRNRLAPDTEGGVTTHLPSGEVMSIYDAAMRYVSDGTPLIVIAGKEYGSGSSRDWAAKGPYLQGIKATLAQSYERIHRSNLIGMGVLPLQFEDGDSAQSLGLTGRERFDIEGLADGIASDFEQGRHVTVRAHPDEGDAITFRALVRIDTPQEVQYYRHGGILQYVLRQLLGSDSATRPLSGDRARPQPRPPSARTVDEQSIASFPASDPPAH